MSFIRVKTKFYTANGQKWPNCDEFKAFGVEKDWTPEMGHVLNKLDVFIAVEPLSWPKFEERREIVDTNLMIRSHDTFFLLTEIHLATY